MGGLTEFCSVVDKMILKEGCTIPCQISVEDIGHAYPRVFKPTTGQIYKNIFYILNSSARGAGARYLCSSSDIGEESDQMNYAYYLGTVWEDGIKYAGYIYMYSYYQEKYPNKVMIYTKSRQIILTQNDKNVRVNPENTDVYNMLVNIDNETSRDKIISYLKNIDRRS